MPTLEAVPFGRVWRGVAVAWALLLAGAMPATGQPARETPNRLVEIAVEGLVQVERSQVLTVIASRIDGPLDADTVTRDLRSVFALGYFQSIKAEVQTIPGVGYRLIFVVKERPRISAIVVTGNKILATKKLEETMTLKVGSVYSQSLVETNMDKIREAYREKGYFQVKLTSDVNKTNELLYVVTIKIEESPRIYITDIRIKGTRVLDTLAIKRLMQSAEVDCFDWMTDSGVFDENKINADLQSIAAQYLRRGYIRVFIDKPKVRIFHRRDYSKLVIELNITEGPQYFVGTVDMTGDILGDKKNLLDALLLKTGQPYSPFDQTQDQFRLSELYGEQGYAFAQINPDRRVNDQTRIVDVTFQIRKGDKAYVGRIEFQGNRETRDFVLRREFQVRENELFNGEKLKESQQNLRILGYFKPNMSIDTDPTEVGNILDTVTRLEETQTGSLQAQLGYSDQSGTIVSLTVAKGNLGGRGQTLRFTSQFAERYITQSFLLDFIEPHLFDTDYSSESSLGLTEMQDITELNRGIITDVTASEGVGYLLLPRLRLGFTYEATDRSFQAPGFPALQLRTGTVSLAWRTVNSPTFPTDGSIVTLAASQVGGEALQGNTEYRRYIFSGQKFVSLNTSGTLVVMGHFRYGMLEQVGDNQIPIEDRFRIGGIYTLRGYNPFEVGGPYGILERSLNTINVPSIDAAGQVVTDVNGTPVMTAIDRRTIGLNEQQMQKLESGGVDQRIFNLELLFPLAGDNFRGVVFYDAGQVNVEPIQYALLKEHQPAFFELLQTYGAGIRMITPMGVFRFEYGVKLNAQPREAPDHFDFTISTLF